MAPWSLEGELVNLSGESDLSKALVSLAMLPDAEALARLEITQDWFAAGAETYQLHFVVHGTDAYFRKFILKACVSCSGSSLTDTLSTWLRRRRLVSDSGVATPLLHCARGATLIEEYVPLTVFEALESPANRASLIDHLALTSAVLDRQGFQIISIHDWRSRGQDVVLVDFGSDLGDAGQAITQPLDLNSQLRANGAKLTAQEHERLREVYANAACSPADWITLKELLPKIA